MQALKYSSCNVLLDVIRLVDKQLISFNCSSYIMSFLIRVYINMPTYKKYYKVLFRSLIITIKVSMTHK